MADLWTIALPILVADILNPVLLAVMILALSEKRPYATSLAVIAGHTFAYFSFGALILFGLADVLSPLFDVLLELLRNPVPTDFLVGLVLGVALLVIAWRWKTAPPKPSETDTQEPGSGVVMAFLFGALVNFIGIPFAVPYFAFLNQLAGLGDSQALSALVIYNCLYAAPFLLVPGALAVFGRSVLPALEKISNWVERIAAYIMPVLLALLGLVLVADAILYFLTGQGLI